MTTKSKSKSVKSGPKKRSQKKSQVADFGRKTVRDEVVLSVKDLKTQFSTKYGTVKAVDGVSFDLKKGETLGIVGESGSGKSVTSLSLMRLVPQPPGEIVDGQVILNGRNLLDLSEKEMTEVRGGEISLILQDPMTALNPCFSIENQVGEGISIHQGDKGKNLFEKVVDALKSVRIPAADQRAKDFPHQLSGGMRQRVVGAIGISSNPSVIIADEPTTSLDVTIQGAYLRLLKQIQEEKTAAKGSPVTDAIMISQVNREALKDIANYTQSKILATGANQNNLFHFYPFTDPATKPLIKYLCKERNTNSGTIIETKALVVKISQF